MAVGKLEMDMMRQTLIAVFRDPSTGRDDLLAFVRSCYRILYERFGADLEKRVVTEQVIALYEQDNGVTDKEINACIKKLQEIRWNKFGEAEAIVFQERDTQRKHVFTGAVAYKIRQDIPGIHDEVKTVFLTVDKTPEKVEEFLPKASTLGALD